MLIRWRTLGLALLPTLLINAEFSFEDIDFDNLGDSDEDVTPKKCQKGNIYCLMQQNTVSPLHNEASRPVDLEENDGENKHDESQGITSLLSLLKSFFPKKGEYDKTKITFNIRDIQSGFHHSGKKYHIGNIQRELLRAKREAENYENENVNANENNEMNNDSSIQDSTAMNVGDTSESVFENATVTEEDLTYSNTTLDTYNYIENTTTTNIDNFTDKAVSEPVLSSTNSTEITKIIVDSDSNSAKTMDYSDMNYSEIPISNKTTDPTAVLSDISYVNQDFNSNSTSTPSTKNELNNRYNFENITVNMNQSLHILQSNNADENNTIVVSANEDINMSDISPDKRNFLIDEFSNETKREEHFEAVPPLDDHNAIVKSSKALLSQSEPKLRARNNILSEDLLKKLQIIIDKELGVDTDNYAAATNFSFTIDDSNSKSNQPIVVIVYKCNCEHNDTESNINNVAQSNNDVSHNAMEKNNNHSYEYFYKYWRMVPHNSKSANSENKTGNTHLNSSITMEKLLQCQTLLASLTNNISGNTENVDRYRDSVNPELESRFGNGMTETRMRTDTNEYSKTPNRYAKSLDEGVPTYNYIDMLADGLKLVSSAPILNYIPVPKEIGTYDNWRKGPQSNILQNLGIDLIKKREVDNTTMSKYMDNGPILSKENNMYLPDNYSYFKYDLDDSNSIDNNSDENKNTIIEINSFNTDIGRNESENDSEYEIVTNAFKYDDDPTAITPFKDITTGVINRKGTIETSTDHNRNRKMYDSSSDSDEYSNYNDDDNEDLDQNFKIKITVLWDNHRFKN